MVRNDLVWKKGRTNNIYSEVGWRGRFLQSHRPPIKKCKFPNKECGGDAGFAVL